MSSGRVTIYVAISKLSGAESFENPSQERK